MGDFFRYLLLSLLLQIFNIVILQAQTPEFLWAQKAANTKGFNPVVYDALVATDAMGNSYVSGFFAHSIVFGNTTLTSNGETDIFIAKYNAAGIVQWAIATGGPTRDYCHGLTVDDAGNVYITGPFLANVTFDNTTLTGDDDFYIAKFNTAGQFLWAEAIGAGLGRINSNDIAVDAKGDILVTGLLWGQSTIGNTTLTSQGVSDFFVAKFNSSGVPLWVRKAGGTGDNFVIGENVSIDGIGNVLVTGYFLGTANFGNNLITANGSIDAFIAKYDAAGTLKWVKKVGGAGDDWGISIGVDAAGNVFNAGYFNGTTITLDSTTLTSNGETDIYVGKFDSDGKLLWAIRGGGIHNDFISGIEVTRGGSLFIFGSFSGNVSLGNVQVAGNGQKSYAFAARLNPAGTIDWIKKAEGTSHVYSSNIAADQDENCFITGEFYADVTFGQSILSTPKNAMFIAKIKASDNFFNADKSIKIFPNPFKDNFTINLQEKLTGEIQLLLTSVDSKVVYRKELITNNDLNKIGISELSDVPPGLYFLHIHLNNDLKVIKVIKR